MELTAPCGIATQRAAGPPAPPGELGGGDARHGEHRGKSIAAAKRQKPAFGIGAGIARCIVFTR
jgi:hypothetical protein